MFFAISAHNGVPIYEQIVRQVKFAVAAGLLAPGERVPSVRELARELVINPNTVARAYRELQTEGILETVRGTGLEIATGAGRLCADERLKLVRARLKEVFREAAQSRLDVKQLRALVERELSALEREEGN
jgi:GntR family transcriptional regulator